MERSPSEYARIRGMYYDKYKGKWRIEKSINGYRYRQTFESHEEAVLCLFNLMKNKLDDNTSGLRFDYDTFQWILVFVKEGEVHTVRFKDTEDVYGYWMKAIKTKGKIDKKEINNLEETIHANLKKYIHGGYFSVKEFTDDVERITWANRVVRRKCMEESVMNGVFLSMCYAMGDGTYKSWHTIEKYLFLHGVLMRAMKVLYYTNLKWRGFVNLSPWVPEATIDEKFAEYKVDGMFDYKKYVIDALKNVLKHPEWREVYMKGSITYAAKFCIARLITEDKMVEPIMLDEKLDELEVTGAIMSLTTSILKGWREKAEKVEETEEH